MNIHSAPQLTPAETALVDAFGERLSLLPGDGAVMVKRDGAIEQIKAGLPTKRIESWHYTDLRGCWPRCRHSTKPRKRPRWRPCSAARPCSRY